MHTLVVGRANVLTVHLTASERKRDILLTYELEARYETSTSLSSKSWSCPKRLQHLKVVES